MPPDFALVAHAHRYAGAKVHIVNNKLQTYIDACYINDREQASFAKHQLYTLLLETVIA